MSACWRDLTAIFTSSRRYMLAPCLLCSYKSSCLSWPFSQVRCSIICERLGVGKFLDACDLSFVASIAIDDPPFWAIFLLMTVGVGGASGGADRGRMFVRLCRLRNGPGQPGTVRSGFRSGPGTRRVAKSPPRARRPAKSPAGLLALLFFSADLGYKDTFILL